MIFQHIYLFELMQFGTFLNDQCYTYGEHFVDHEDVHVWVTFIPLYIDYILEFVNDFKSHKFYGPTLLTFREFSS